jgi:putative transposase
LRDECLDVHQFTSLAEVQTKIEAWRRENTHRRFPNSLDHLTPNEFVAQRQASRVAEEVAYSSSGLSRDGTNVRVGLYLMEA